MSEYPPSPHVEVRDDVMQIRLAVPMGLKSELERLADESEYSDWNYTKRVRHNTPVAELILRDMVLPALEGEGE